MDHGLLYRMFEGNDENAEIEAQFGMDDPLDFELIGEGGGVLEEFPALNEVEAAVQGANPPTEAVLEDAALEAELAVEGEPLLELLEQQIESAAPCGEVLFPNDSLEFDDLDTEQAFGGQGGLDELAALLRDHRGLRITLSHDSSCDCG